MYGWTWRARSAAGVTTIYGKGYARDHGCIIAKQKHNGSGDFGLRCPASQRHLLEKRAADVVTTPVPRRHWRHDHGGIDRIDADVVLAQFQCGDPSDAVEGSFRDAIGDVPGQGD